MPPEVTHGGDVALTHLDQTCGRQPFERLADRGSRHSEQLSQPTLAGQRLAGRHLAGEHIGSDLLEDLFGHRSASHRLQRHAPSVNEDW
ncbi:Uncharacterised protein [Mycobacterium tuberculosis]|nr:Uncharacterised protein [Mycobacterium tuberculosis]